MTRSLFLFLFACAALTSFGCGEDDDADTCNQAAFIELTTTIGVDVQAAATVYANDQTDENCNDYRVALESYLAELRRFETCSSVSGTQNFATTVDAIEMSINDLPCS
jgi:hypothetical protein